MGFIATPFKQVYTLHINYFDTIHLNLITPNFPRDR